MKIIDRIINWIYSRRDVKIQCFTAYYCYPDENDTCYIQDIPSIRYERRAKSITNCHKFVCLDREDFIDKIIHYLGYNLRCYLPSYPKFDSYYVFNPERNNYDWFSESKSKASHYVTVTTWRRKNGHIRFDFNCDGLFISSLEADEENKYLSNMLYNTLYNLVESVCGFEIDNELYREFEECRNTGTFMKGIGIEYEDSNRKEDRANVNSTNEVS